MRNIVFIGLFLVIFGGYTPLSAQKWSTKDKKEFSESCTAQMAKESNITNKLAEKICDCLSDRLEQKYPKIDDLSTFIESDPTGFTKMMEIEGYECGKQLVKDNPEVVKEIAKNEKVTSQLEYDQKMADDFVQECQSAAKNRKDLEDVNFNQYCSCMWDKIQEKYPKVGDFLKIVGEGKDKLMEHFENEAIDCVKASIKKQDAQVAYPAEFKNEFMEGCVKGVKGNKEINGKKYCSCFLEKLQVMYPNYADFLSTIEEKGQEGLTEDMKAEGLECLEGAKKSKK